MHGYYVELCNSITCIVLYHVIMYVCICILPRAKVHNVSSINPCQSAIGN